MSLIGNTPLVELRNIERQFGLKAHLFAKLEMYNLTGSAKDRVALRIIEDAEKSGALKKGGVIIEATSGNTGIGLAAVGCSKGYRVIIVMPDNMSKERIDLIKSYGAEVVLTLASEGMGGSVQKAKEIALSNEGSFIADQFNNPSNALAHFDSTGPEVFKQTEGNVDVFVAGIGTGGTISGTGKYLKSQKSVEVVGVEPASSPLITRGFAGSHKIQGIGANFIPTVLDRAVLDRVVPVTDEDAYLFTRALVRAEGVLAGISSGAALKAAVDIAKDDKYIGKNVVVLLPDSGMRYISTGVFNG